MPVKLVIRWRPLALFGLGLLGLALRLYGLNWDQGNNFHPDERQILFHVVSLSWPSSFAQFLDPVNSPLNPHFFAYGSFPLYLLALLGHIILRPTPGADSLSAFTLVGRVLSALFDSGTILLVGWLGLLLTPDNGPGRRYAWNVALLAAALVTFTPFQLQLAHFYAVDTVMLFFVMLCLVACVKLVTCQRLLLWALFVGFSYGLALATKFSAAPLAVPVCVAILLRWYRQRDTASALITLLFTALVTLLVFLLAQPYALLDWRNFIAQVVDQGDLVRGTLDLPYVRQFAGTLPLVYEVQNMVLWGLGIALGLAGFAGLLWLLWRVWRRKAGLWLIVLSWVIVYGAINCSFYVKYMRYMLPVYPLFALMAAALLLALVRREWKIDTSAHAWLRGCALLFRYALVALVLLGTIFQGLALLNVYSQPNTRIQASRWMYTHLKSGSMLTYEQWDDPLPVVDNQYASTFVQATYPDDSGNPTTGLDLYGDDTEAKARQLARILPTVDAITMATDRLDKSIPRLPSRYPLTIRYYQLLFSGQLGFHLAAQFENHPNLLGITLDDSNADESYSVFDHPTARIFVRDNPYPYTPEQLFQKLTAGVPLPAPAAQLSGAQRTLLLSPQQISEDQQSPPFSVQFPAGSLSNRLPVVIWWLTLLLLGVVVYPLVFSLFRGISDRGYFFSKTLGILLLAYLAWLLAATHILPFSALSLALVMAVLLISGAIACFLQRSAISAFLRQHWRRVLLSEVLFTLAFLLFVGVRSLNPDLWSAYRGGEKPMELAFLNAVLRSPYMPPLDPWFSGGYINYYYYGYVVIGALTKLTGILPTTAFNLAIPTLFALTFTGAAVIVYSFTGGLRWALLGGYLTALIGNLDGFVQFRGQLVALLAHIKSPPFDYWQSSRIIPFTINEFPFWSFLFADMHPHVIDMPIAVLMLGMLAALLLSVPRPEDISVDKSYHKKKVFLYLIAAFVLGTIACINPWDMPVYLILLAVVLLIQCVQEHREASGGELFVALVQRVVVLVALFGLGYLFYLPFYLPYQQLYINGLGLVKSGTGMGDFLLVFGLWIFLALSFFLVEFYQRLMRRQQGMAGAEPATWQRVTYITVCFVTLLVLMIVGPRALLAASLVLGIYLFAALLKAQWRFPGSPVVSNLDAGKLGEEDATSPSGVFIEEAHKQQQIYTYLLLLMSLCICLGIELVYIRDFLDGSDYARMNTVFKFSMQAWLCFGIGSALVIHRLWHQLRDLGRRVWMMVLVVLLLSCSVFLIAGTSARIADHSGRVGAQLTGLTASYAPTLDGFAFVRTWYPDDAGAIEWLNDHVSGSPVVLEATVPISYQWFNRVSVYTGLPDVLGWPDHESEQRYNNQALGRLSDIGIMYTTPDPRQALALLHYYHVRYVYVGPLERNVYGATSPASLDKFDHMAALRVVYRSGGSVIYEVTG